jgi:dTDP-glucose pyrophosphorylase
MTEIDKPWTKAILHLDANIKEAVEVLNQSSLKIVLVTDATGVLVGTISDGDIRRGLLRGLFLESPIESIIHHGALVVNSGTNRASVIQLMLENKVQQIPVIDEMKHLIGLHLWDELSSPPLRTNIMVIMAGGKGTRLYPQTENCPKPMLPIAGKPILEHIISKAKVAGFSNFILAVHYLGHMVEEYFGDGSQLGVNIQYLREESPLGTAGALSLLGPLSEQPIVVTNGDVISDIPYGEILDFHQKNMGLATMAVRFHEWQNPYGVVQTNGLEIIGYEEKPVTRNYINAGVYVIDTSVISLLPKMEPCDMPMLFEKIRATYGKTLAYPVHEQWIDIGRPSDLARAISLNEPTD